MNFELSKHACRQFEIRNISEETILFILNNPDRVENAGASEAIYSKLVYESEKLYLYRVFVNDNKTPPLVITGYKTSKFGKYGYTV